MKIQFKYTRPDATRLAFRSATINSVFIKSSFPMLFFLGDTSQLISINKYTENNVDVNSFSFTNGNFQKKWGDQYHSNVEPWLKKIKSFKPVLYSLELGRIVNYGDFMLSTPPREGEAFFTKQVDDPNETFEIFYFDKGINSKLEDLAILESLCSWYNFGIESVEKQEQSEEGRFLMVYLHETYRNRGFPKYLDPARVRGRSAWANFVSNNDYFTQRATKNMGKLFEESRSRIFGVGSFNDELSSVFDESNSAGSEDPPFLDSLDFEALVPFIRHGSIQLSELVYDFGVDRAVELLKGTERLEVIPDMAYQFIKKMVLTPDSVLIVKIGDKDIEYYADMLGIEHSTIMLSADVNDIK